MKNILNILHMVSDQTKVAHTALTCIQNSFTGTNWFIEGNIKGFFDNINHEDLIKILKERIDDERFIRLIRKFSNADTSKSESFTKRTLKHRKVESIAPYWQIFTWTGSTNT